MRLAGAHGGQELASQRHADGGLAHLLARGLKVARVQDRPQAVAVQCVHKQEGDAARLREVAARGEDNLLAKVRVGAQQPDGGARDGKTLGHDVHGARHAALPRYHLQRAKRAGAQADSEGGHKVGRLRLLAAIEPRNVRHPGAVQVCCDVAAQRQRQVRHGAPRPDALDVHHGAVVKELARLHAQAARQLNVRHVAVQVVALRRHVLAGRVHLGEDAGGVAHDHGVRAGGHQDAHGGHEALRGVDGHGGRPAHQCDGLRRPLQRRGVAVKRRRGVVIQHAQPSGRAGGHQDSGEVPGARHPVRLQQQQDDKGGEGERGGGDAKPHLEAVHQAVGAQRAQDLGQLHKPQEADEAQRAAVVRRHDDVPRHGGGKVNDEHAAQVVQRDGAVVLHVLVGAGVKVGREEVEQQVREEHDLQDRVDHKQRRRVVVRGGGGQERHLKRRDEPREQQRHQHERVPVLEEPAIGLKHARRHLLLYYQRAVLTAAAARATSSSSTAAATAHPTPYRLLVSAVRSCYPHTHAPPVHRGGRRTAAASRILLRHHCAQRACYRHLAARRRAW